MWFVIWLIAAIGLMLVYFAWFVTLTYYPPASDNVPSRTIGATFKGYCCWRLIADPNRNADSLDKEGKAVRSYNLKKISWRMGLSVLAILVLAGLLLMVLTSFLPWTRWPILAAWTVATPFLTVWLTYRSNEGTLVSPMEAIRAYPLTWSLLVLACLSLAATPWLPGGREFREWIYNFGGRQWLVAGLAAILAGMIGRALSPIASLAPPEGCSEIPLQWRIWMAITCVVGFLTCMLLIGLAG